MIWSLCPSRRRCRRRSERSLRARTVRAAAAARASAPAPWTGRSCRAAPRRSNICEPGRRRGSAAASLRRARSAIRNCRSARTPREIRGFRMAWPPSHRVQIVGIDQIEVLVVLPRDHRIFAVDLARKQRHALVARGACPCRGDIRNDTKSLVSISSDRIAAPL